MKIDWKTCFRIGVTAVLIVLCITFLPDAGNMLLRLLSAAAPLLVGCVIAYLVNILMAKYEKIYFPKSKKKFIENSRRPVSLLLAFLTFVVILVLIVSLVLPQLASCISLLIRKVPAAIKVLIDALDNFKIVPDNIMNSLSSIDWQAKISQFIKVVTSGVGDAINLVIGTLSSVFSGLVTMLIALIFSIYLLSDKEKIAGQYTKLMKRYVNPNITKKINYVLAVMNDCFRRYIIGQCTEAIILGCLCTVGMWILKLPYATMIGALIAFTALIPVAGAYIGAGVGAFMILSVDPLKALLFLVFLVILQQMEGNIIYPRVVGSSIGLPGIWVLAAVTIGGGMMGIMGMLVGVPLAATFYRLLREDVKKASVKAKTNMKNSSTNNSNLKDSNTKNNNIKK